MVKGAGHAGDIGDAHRSVDAEPVRRGQHDHVRLGCGKATTELVHRATGELNVVGIISEVRDERPPVRRDAGENDPTDWVLGVGFWVLA